MLHVTQGARDRARALAWFSAQEAVRAGLLQSSGGAPEVKPLPGPGSRAGPDRVRKI